MGFRYNLGMMVADLAERKYTHASAGIHEHTDKMETYQGQFEALTKLLTEVHAAQQTNKGYVNLEQHRELIDEVRSFSSPLARVLPEGVYEWNNEDAIKLVTDTLSQESKTIATLVNPEMMYVNQGLQDLGELIKIFSKILEIQSREQEHYVRKQTNG